MRRLSRKFFPGAALTVACLASLLAGDCRGDAISSWQGATVSVSAAGRDASNSGATASASTSGNTVASSLGSYGQPVSIGYSSSANASASANGSQLLSVSTNLSQGTTGVLNSRESATQFARAFTDWSHPARWHSAVVRGIQRDIRFGAHSIAPSRAGTGNARHVGIDCRVRRDLETSRQSYQSTAVLAHSGRCVHSITEIPLPLHPLNQ